MRTGPSGRRPLQTIGSHAPGRFGR